jgi:hypothetical protein
MIVPPPVEKLPIFVLGAVLALIGGFLATQESMFSWAQFEALAMVVVGLGAAVYDAARRVRHAKQTENDDAKSD